LLLDADGHLQLDERIAREGVYTDGGADVTAFFFEDSNKKVRGSVQDGWAIGKAWYAIYVAVNGEDFRDVVQRAELAPDYGELCESAGARGDVSLVHGAVRTGFASDYAFRAHRDNTGKVQDAINTLGRDVISAGPGQLRQGES
jgi:hypothetical protein